ncbi:hypothetical protein VINI7043_01745 [Vibrio nigripulchritudo ATCC 27043]|uniref:DUF2057 domain-containing protein n=1 Tax=Vibrio nigripulchritudo TaxID=28173 RepID=UPI00021C3873|nr:DUF2057 domain-containing protein [Vibrio nigripulchritudo]EGU55102.1 hypothetical protein VINI7043_01745 [Vibrio nigripulchritudo ATCC 27043]
MAFALRIVVLALAGFTSFTFASPLTLNLSNELTPRTLNGAKIESQWIKSTSALEIQPGLNQIAVTIGQIVVEDGRRTKYYSQPYVLLFEARESLTLDYKAFRTMSDARQFEKAPTFTLTDASSNSIDYKIDTIHIGGLQTLQDFEGAIRRYNEKGEGLAVYRSEKETTVTLTHSEEHLLKSAQSAFQDLNSETQRKFMAWAMENLK